MDTREKGLIDAISWENIGESSNVIFYNNIQTTYNNYHTCFFEMANNLENYGCEPKGSLKIKNNVIRKVFSTKPNFKY